MEDLYFFWRMWCWSVHALLYVVILLTFLVRYIYRGLVSCAADVIRAGCGNIFLIFCTVTWNFMFFDTDHFLCKALEVLYG